MYIAVIDRPHDPNSLRIFQNNLLRVLSSRGVEITRIDEAGLVPAGCQLLWDPAMCMRPLPRVFWATTRPIVGSMHGVKAFSMPLAELTRDRNQQRELRQLKEVLARQWAELSDRIKAVTAVSNYALQEVQQALDLPGEKLHLVGNGLDGNIFRPEGPSAVRTKPYFLWVGRLDPIKNVSRLLNAYRALPPATRPDLVMLVEPEADQAELQARFQKTATEPGIHHLTGNLPQAKVAELYRGALALVLPSLRETFGLPIVEAMACGCPVITAHDSGCTETAGDAALLVDPRDEASIRAAMTRLINDETLRRDLRTRGLRRAADFDWKQSGNRLLTVFQSLLPVRRKRQPKVRKVEITTTASCKVACLFCPQDAYRNGYLRKKHTRILTLESFQRALDRLPPEVGVSFGGMTEAFQNQDCLEMICRAKQRGHALEVFSTLVDFQPDDVEDLLALLDANRDRLYIHLPSEGKLERIPVSEAYLRMIHRLRSGTEPVTFHYHGDQLHKDLQGIDFGNRLAHWPIHNRAAYGTDMAPLAERKAGPLTCVMNLEVPVMLPNGDLVMCSQDFGANYIVGNLIRQPIEEIFAGAKFQAILEAMDDDSQEIMCRYCHFSIEEQQQRFDGSLE